MKKILYLLIVILAVGSVSSCKDMDGIYQEFLIPNGKKYPQRPDSLKAFAGYNKLRVTWLEAKDPSLTHAMVYWNNYLDSLRVDLNNQKDTIVVDIEGLNESTYTFYVVTFDRNGNASIPSEVSGTAYGDNFLMGATDRTIASSLRDNDRVGTITWNNKTADLVYSEVRYTTSSGETKTVRVLPDEITVRCPDIKPGEFFEYRSVFLPPNGIDSVGREWRVSDTPFMYKYPRTTWTAVAKNGNHPWGDGGGGQPWLIFDGNFTTGWHSTVGTPFPQCIVVDMKESLMVDYVLIYPPAQVNWRYLRDVRIYLTDEPIDPNSPDFGSIVEGMVPAVAATYPGGDSFRLDLPTPQAGQYMTVLFPNGTQPYISFMELEVFGY